MGDFRRGTKKFERINIGIKKRKITLGYFPLFIVSFYKKLTVPKPIGRFKRSHIVKNIILDINILIE